MIGDSSGVSARIANSARKGKLSHDLIIRRGQMDFTRLDPYMSGNALCEEVLAVFDEDRQYV